MRNYRVFLNDKIIKEFLVDLSLFVELGSMIKIATVSYMITQSTINIDDLTIDLTVVNAE